MNIIESNLTEADWIKIVLNKDRLGAEVLYDRFGKVLLLAIVRIVWQKEAAEAVLQQTFLETWNSLDKYLLQKEKLLAWMLQIARRLAYDYLIKADAVALGA